MDRPTTLELLAALERASEETDAWLGSLREESILDSCHQSHPWVGMGAPAAEVAQVLVHGETNHARQKRLRDVTLARNGLTVREWTTDVGWDRYAAVRDQMFGPNLELLIYETASERATTVAALIRARKECLVVKSVHTFWQITADGDSALREATADDIAA